MESKICSRLAQVPTFSFLTLTFIFKVKLLTFYFICEYIINGEREQLLLLPPDKKSRICHRMAPLQILYVVTLTYIIKVKKLKCEYLKNG